MKRDKFDKAEEKHDEPRAIITGPPCPECGRQMRWIESPAPARANIKPRHDCPVCVDPGDDA